MLKQKFLNVGDIGLVFLFRVNVLRFFHEEEAELSSHEGRSEHRPAQVTVGGLVHVTTSRCLFSLLQATIAEREEKGKC